jgi:hypothetical protein
VGRFDSGSNLIYTISDADFGPKNKTFLTILAILRFHNYVETSEKKC